MNPWVSQIPIITLTLAVVAALGYLFGRRQRVAENERLFRSGRELRRAQSAQAAIDHDLYPQNSPEQVAELLGLMQALAFRLQALEESYGRVVRQVPDERPLDRALADARDVLRGVYGACPPRCRIGNAAS